MKIEKLWGGRFEELPSKEMVEFLSGRDVRGIPPCDERLIPYDLWGDRAHILMLCRQGILLKRDGKRILKGLKEIETLHQKGSFRLDASKEDVHSNIESFLIERVGIESGGKVHTGRSRNDQIVLDMRLYLRGQVLEFVEGLVFLIMTLLQKASSTWRPGTRWRRSRRAGTSATWWRTSPGSSRGPTPRAGPHMSGAPKASCRTDRPGPRYRGCAGPPP